MVMPVANVSATLEASLGRILAWLAAGDRLYCVVDRGSQDDTRTVLEQWAGRDPRVIAVWAPENRSPVDAYVRGYEAALAGDHEWILEMDFPPSHDPDQIPEFLAAMATGVDFVAGSRFAPGGSHEGGALRYFYSKGGTVLANLALGTRMSDMTSGFECFTRAALEAVLAEGIRSRGHFFQTEVRYLMSRRRYVEVPIRYRSSSTSVRVSYVADSILQLLGLAWRARRRQPRAVPEVSRARGV